MTTYRLSANPAKPHAHGFSVSYSLRGDRLVGDEQLVEIKNADQLIAAQESMASAVLAANHSLEGVAIYPKPLTRHAKGCKDVRTLCIARA